jgi:hypothetical protein
MPHSFVWGFICGVHFANAVVSHALGNMPAAVCSAVAATVSLLVIAMRAKWGDA